MSRYIDADKLKAHYAWWGDKEIYVNKQVIDEIVDTQPTADVVPLKDYQSMERTCKKLQDRLADVRENVKGEWIIANEQPYFRKHYNNVVCSVCHRKGDSRWNFCPNCGASMRGDNNE